jgi:uncharacterized membrane protein YuzA (DUF378 family)
MKKFNAFFSSKRTSRMLVVLGLLNLGLIFYLPVDSLLSAVLFHTMCGLLPLIVGVVGLLNE